MLATELCNYVVHRVCSARFGLVFLLLLLLLHHESLGADPRQSSLRSPSQGVIFDDTFGPEMGGVQPTNRAALAQGILVLI